MIEGLAWLAASVATLGAVAWIVPRAVVATVATWRTRNREQATPTPSAACPQCGGAWGKWSALITDTRPNNATYPSLSGTHQIHSQTRACAECGYGDRRVLG